MNRENRISEKEESRLGRAARSPLPPKFCVQLPAWLRQAERNHHYRAGILRPREAEILSGFPLSGRSRRILRAHLGREFREVPKPDSLADLPHDVKVKVDVVVGGEDGGGELVRSEKMPEIRARVPAANGTRAGGIHRPLVVRVARVFDQHAALGSVKAGMARRAG